MLGDDLEFQAVSYLSLIGPAVTVVVGVLGYYYFRANRKKTELRHDITIRRIFPPGSEAPITIGGSDVNDPFEVQLWFQPTGLDDITSGAFDAGNLPYLALGTPLLAEPTSGSAEFKVTGKPGEDQVAIVPQTLKCGVLVYASMLVDGPPTPTFHAVLANIDVKRFDVQEAGLQTLKGLFSASRVIPTAVALVFAVMAGLIANLTTQTARPTDTSQIQDKFEAALMYKVVQRQEKEEVATTRLICDLINQAFAIRGLPPPTPAPDDPNRVADREKAALWICGSPLTPTPPASPEPHR
jgi:hypothetical protein